MTFSANALFFSGWSLGALMMISSPISVILTTYKAYAGLARLLDEAT